MTARRVKLDLVEVHDDAQLGELAALVRSDADGMAEFGGFYGDAGTRLAPLLGEDRRAWLLRVDGETVGFVDADNVDGVVGLSYLVAEPFRRRGVASGAIGRLLGMRPWPDAALFSASVDPRNVASREVLRATGFRLVGTNEYGELVWQRVPPKPRRTGPARFLDDDGRIDRYPLRDADRRELLAWIADRALPLGTVLAERDVNEMLSPLAPGGDVAVLRRYLVDHGLLERTRSGSEYSRVADSAG